MTEVVKTEKLQVHVKSSKTVMTVENLAIVAKDSLRLNDTHSQKRAGFVVCKML